jgi:hypothetical protein
MGTSGIVPTNPWDVDLVPGKEMSECVVSNVDAHHWLHYDFRKKKLLGVIGSPGGEMGMRDGPNSLLRRPRMVARHPDGKRLLGSQAWNHCFGEINLADYSFTTKIRSVNNWDTYYGGNTRGTNFPYVPSTVRTMPTNTSTPWEMDGGPGVASFHHPQSGACDRNGLVISGADHVRDLLEWDPDRNTVRVLARLPDGGWSANVPDNATRAWQSIDVGSVGTQDIIAFADWDMVKLYKRDGTAIGDVVQGPTHKGTRMGSNYRVFDSGYPWAVMFRKGPAALGQTAGDITALVWGDAGSTCL